MKLHKLFWIAFFRSKQKGGMFIGVNRIKHLYSLNAAVAADRVVKRKAVGTVQDHMRDKTEMRGDTEYVAKQGTHSSTIVHLLRRYQEFVMYAFR